jgi:hypothetical protein
MEFTRIYAGLLRAGLGPSERVYRGAHGGWTGVQFLHQIGKTDSVAEWLGFGPRGLICKSTIIDTVEKDKNVCNTVGSR